MCSSTSAGARDRTTGARARATCSAPVARRWCSRCWPGHSFGMPRSERWHGQPACRSGRSNSTLKLLKQARLHPHRNTTWTSRPASTCGPRHSRPAWRTESRSRAITRPATAKEPEVSGVLRALPQHPTWCGHRTPSCTSTSSTRGWPWPIDGVLTAKRTSRFDAGSGPSPPAATGGTKQRLPLGLLVYADLMASEDPRERTAANEWRKRHVRCGKHA